MDPLTTVVVNSEDPFYTVLGLPVHVLVVHGAVVLLPLAALGIIAMVFVPRLRRSLGWLVFAVLVVAVGFAFLSRFSGVALAERLGEPEPHARLGNVLPWVALALALITLVWWLTAAAGERRAERQTAGPLSPEAAATAAGYGGDTTTVLLDEAAGEAPSRTRSAAATFTGALTVTVAIATLAWTAVTGHTGSQAVWAGTIEALDAATPSPEPTTGPSPSASVSPSLSPSPSPSRTSASASSSAAPRASATASAAVFALAEVRRHSSAIDCWVAIDGRVYNLTAWVNQHPGGPERIESICGTDASSQFSAQHGGQSLPNRELGAFQIGRLG